MPGSSGVRRASAARCSRATAASWLVCPKVNSRRKIPSVDGAYTSPNTRGVPPARSTFTSSMLSAPHIMPAMIVVSFPAGLTAPEATRVLGRSTCSSISSERPVCSASSSTGTNPAADTRFCSSNTADPTVNLCDDCTENAFPNAGQTRPQQSLLSQFRRHFHCSHADRQRPTVHGFRLSPAIEGVLLDSTPDRFLPVEDPAHQSTNVERLQPISE